MLEAAGIPSRLIYTEGGGESLGLCLKSLFPGDTLAVTTLARLHNRRDGLVAAVRDLADMGVTIWEVSTGEKFEPGQMSRAMKKAFEALDELANDKRLMTAREGRKAAEIRHSRTPTAKARVIWENLADYPTTGEALEHADMDGWDSAAAYKKLGPRGSAVRRKR